MSEAVALAAAYDSALGALFQEMFSDAAADGDMPGAETRFARGVTLLRTARARAQAILANPREAKTMTFRFGRKRPSPFARRLKFAHYAAPSLPSPPAVVHWGGEAGHWAALENIFGNDTLGDCTAAGAAHAEVIWRGAARNGAAIPTAAETIAFYSGSTGYDPNAAPDASGNNPTDQGGDEVTVLNYWKTKGFFGDGVHGKIAAWATVDGRNQTEIKQALWLGESLYFGVELPDPWVSPMPDRSGFVWDVAGPADPNNGHCFVGIGYNAAGVQIDTWGLFGTISWAAIRQYATTLSQGELYVMFSEDAISRATQKAPNGFDWKALLADSSEL